MTADGQQTDHPVAPEPVEGAARRLRLGVVDLVYVGVALLLFARVPVEGGRLFGRDIMHYFLPIAATVRSAWETGGSLLWDPGVFHGLPLVARWSAAIFYPPQWLLFFVPGDIALTWILALHLPLAASSMERLARRYVTDRRATALAGLAYGFSGYVVSMVGGVTYLYGATLLPLSLLMLHRLAEMPRLGRILALAVVWALQVFVADPQTLFCEVVFVAPLILYSSAHDGLGRVFVSAAVAGVVTIGMSFCQLWPTLELAALSTRASTMPLAATEVWSLHPLRLLEVVVPGLFGVIGTQNDFWARDLISGPFNVPWAAGLHVGLLTVVGLLSWRRVDLGRRTWVWIGLTLLFVLLALGQHTPVHAVVQALVPGAGRFRYPEKFMLFVTVGLVLLGAVGLGRLLQMLQDRDVTSHRSRRRLAIVLGALAVALAATAIFAAFEIPVTVDRWVRALSSRAVGADEVRTGLASTVAALWRAAGVAALLAGLVLLSPKLRPRLSVGLLFATTVVELVSAAWPVVQLTSDLWPKAAPLGCELLPRANLTTAPFFYRSSRLRYSEVPGDADRGSRFERQREWEYHTLTPNTAAPWCGRYVTGYDAVKLASWQRFEETVGADAGRYLDLLGAQTILAAPAELDPVRFPLRSLYSEIGLSVHDNNGLPYAQTLAAVGSAPDFEAALARLADPAFNYRESAVFETAQALPTEPEAVRRSEVTRYAPGDVELSASFAAPGFLVVQENNYPGWTATVDDVPALVYRANALFVGLAIEAGEHHVRLTFAPVRQRLGNWVSLLTWAGVLTLLLGTGLHLRRASLPLPESPPTAPVRTQRCRR